MAVLASISLANVAIAAQTPTAYFGSATVNTSNNRIQATGVPVQDANGAIVYKNIALDFQVDAAGNVSLVADSPTITTTPRLVTSGFKAGNYKDALGTVYTVSGPSAIPGSTRSSWSLVANGSTQFSASWITGKISGHPNQDSLTVRNITSTAFTWGTVGVNGFQFVSGAVFNSWAPSAVVGVTQAGNQLVLHLFVNYDAIEDSSVALQYCNTAC